MEGDRWWKLKLGLTEEEWEEIATAHPTLRTSAACGYYNHGVRIAIFLGRIEGDLVTGLVDCWLHEYIEVIEEVSNHAAFNDTVIGITEYVLAP